MKKLAIIGFALAILAGAGVLEAQDVPKKSGPLKEHEWLKQLVGEWDAESEATLEPGKPPMKSKGSESVRGVGDFWIMAENKGTDNGVPFTGILTVGYDPQKKKYVGTWIDSMNSHLVTFEGALDEAGKTLSLLAEAPNPAAAGKTSKYKDAFEVKGKDHKVLTSAVQGDDGKWITFLTVNYRRKK